MKLVEIDWKPSERQLRQFGWIALVGLPLAGWMFSGRPWPGAFSSTQAAVVGSLAALGVLFAALGAVRPQLLRYPFLILMLVAFPIGLVLSELILVIIYFLLFVPVALVFRLIGRDALERHIDRSAKTYWQAKAQPRDLESYFRQS